MSRIDVPVNSPLDAVCDMLSRFDKLSEAEALLDTFAEIFPKGNTEALDELARNYYRIKSYPKSIQALEQSIAVTRDNQTLFSIRANLAKMYNHINQPEKSLAMSKVNLMLDPTNFDAMMETQFSHYLMGEVDKSEQILRDMLDIPVLPEELRKRILFNLGTYDLYHGEFQKGLRGFITGGKAIGIWPDAVKGYRKWDGNVTDEVLYIIEEGGIGDSIINVRFAKMAQEIGQTCVWVTLREDLMTVYNRNGITTILMSEFKTYDDPLVAGAMDMPILLNVEPEQLWTGPYLAPSPEHVAKWKRVIGDGVMVGAKWSGNPLYEQDLHRSISAQIIKDIVTEADPGTELVCLQLEHNRQEGLDLGFLDVAIESWEDTLAILSLLKYTITSCTSIAHAAGAIGAQVYVMVPRAAYYTWCWVEEEQPFSIWYGENLEWYQKTDHISWDTASQAIKFQIKHTLGD